VSYGHRIGKTCQQLQDLPEKTTVDNGGAVIAEGAHSGSVKGGKVGRLSAAPPAAQRAYRVNPTDPVAAAFSFIKAATAAESTAAPYSALPPRR